LIHLSLLIHKKLMHICARTSAMTFAFVLVCSLAIAVNATATAANPINMSPPQVLVLIWAGAGWTDLVSINYDGVVPEKTVREDVESISKGTGWAVNNLHVTTKKIPVPGANNSTSATFDTNTGLASGSATVHIDPIVLAFKRLDRLQISILAGKTTPINAPNGFVDDKISITGVYNLGNIQYAVKIIDHNISQLDWPNPQTGQVANTKGRNSGKNVLIIIFIAAGGAAVAYVITRKLTHK